MREAWFSIRDAVPGPPRTNKGNSGAALLPADDARRFEDKGPSGPLATSARNVFIDGAGHAS